MESHFNRLLWRFVFTQRPNARRTSRARQAQGSSGRTLEQRRSHRFSKYVRAKTQSDQNYLEQGESQNRKLPQKSFFTISALLTNHAIIAAMSCGLRNVETSPTFFHVQIMTFV